MEKNTFFLDFEPIFCYLGVFAQNVQMKSCKRSSPSQLVHKNISSLRLVSTNRKTRTQPENGEAKEKGKIGADKVCESQVLDRFCLGQVNTMSKTRRAKYASLRQKRGILQNKSHGTCQLWDISPLPWASESP